MGNDKREWIQKNKTVIQSKTISTSIQIFITISIPTFSPFLQTLILFKTISFPSSFNSNFHLFSFLIVLVVCCYCYPILISITLLYQMNQCDWYALFHTPQTNTLKASVVFIQTRFVIIIHTEWDIIPELYSSFGFNNCLREGKEPTTKQPCHLEQWLLLRNKWINPPFFTHSTNSEIISF